MGMLKVYTVDVPPKKSRLNRIRCIKVNSRDVQGVQESCQKKSNLFPKCIGKKSIIGAYNVSIDEETDKQKNNLLNHKNVGKGKLFFASSLHTAFSLNRNKK